MQDKSYQSYSRWKEWQAESFSSFSIDEAFYFELELKLAVSEGLSGKRVVEVGFGNGSFAAWATEVGADYAGVELIPELVRAGQDKDMEVYLADKELSEIFPENSVDLIVAFDVLEHFSIVELKSFLRKCASILRPDGILLARVPSGDSPFSRAIQHGDITHQSILGSSAVRQLSDEAGLHVLSVRGPAFPILGCGMVSASRRIIVRIFQLVSHAIIANALMGKKDTVLTPNLVFVLKKVPR